ncbi:hypothetical protein [Streptomyces humi]|uniref:hypothetical protein n=1 Tax=Streptomyces humi TaxID=1428620 RepID=UPI00142E5964|nr:hypothetical protein [Streptomyces humi]
MTAPPSDRCRDDVRPWGNEDEAESIRIIHPGVTVNPVDDSYGDFEPRADQRRR